MEDTTSGGTSLADGVPPGVSLPQLGPSDRRMPPLPYRQSSGTGHSLLQSVEYEEELALALAISASVADETRHNVPQQNEWKDKQELRKRQEEEDRDYAFALQLQSQEEMLHPGRPSPDPLVGQPSGSSAPGPPSAAGRDGRRGSPSGRHAGLDTEPPATSSPDEIWDAHRCAGCNKWLGIRQWTSALGKKWHPDCFRCAGCRKNILGHYTPKDGEPYHPECHRLLFHERCKVCGDPLPMVGNRISWSEHPFWQQKYCGKHNADGTPRCTACERLKGQGENWISLQDGRELCSCCVETIVVDTQDCQPLYSEILQMYRELGLPVPSRPPLMLVDQQALNECDAHEGHHKGAPQSQTRGMTLAEEYRSIRTVRKSSGWAVFPEIVPVERRQCSVTAILVLYGLPRLLTGSILAHEVMHAWLKLNNITRLSQDVEEGLCQLMALIWLERQQQKDPYERRLCSFVAHQIRTNPTIVYGDGFRAAHASFQRFGLKAVVDHVRETGELPVPDGRVSTDGAQIL